MKIFLVDDSGPLLRSLATMLRDVPGVEIIGEAGGVRQAVAGIIATQPQVVVLDIRLQDGSGLEVLKSVRPQAPEAMFIVFTGCPAAQYRQPALKEGAAYFFEKSAEEEKLMHCIRSLVEIAAGLRSERALEDRHA